jgi:hypothetical protein
MKNPKLLTLFALALFFSADWAFGQKAPGLDASPADISYLRTEGRKGDPIARIVYGRPQKKGRTMLGGTEKYGEVWRTGANETTEVKLYRDVTFGDKSLKAGSYAVYTIPNKDQWTIIFNSKLDTWGHYAYDESKDVARVNVPAEKSDSEIEAFTIYFEDPKDNSSNMVVAWENTLVKVPVKY